MIVTTRTHPLAKPFLKWAGGKTQLLPQLDRFFPEALRRGEISRYVEPFVGGGAMFLYVAQYYPVRECWIADINPELVLAYRTLRVAVEPLISGLQAVETDYLCRDNEGRKAYYYEVRSRFNAERSGFDYGQFSPAWVDRVVQSTLLGAILKFSHACDVGIQVSI